MNKKFTLIHGVEQKVQVIKNYSFLREVYN